MSHIVREYTRAFRETLSHLEKCPMEMNLSVTHEHEIYVGNEKEKVFIEPGDYIREKDERYLSQFRAPKD